MKLVLAIVAVFMSGFAYAGEVSLMLAGLRLMPEQWDKQANFAKMERYARQAAAQGAQLVITPEGYLEGYVGNQGRTKELTREKYFPVGESIDGPIMVRIQALARELKIYLLVGFAERRDDRMYNTAAIFGPDGSLVSRYSKTHTANDEPLNTKGTEFPVVQTALGRWGTLICIDRQMPETSRILAIKGAQLILVPAWGGFSEMNDTMMRTRAYENGVHVAFVHPKRCLFIDPSGKIIAQDKPGDGDQIVTARIRLKDEGPIGPIQFRRPELYREITTSH